MTLASAGEPISTAARKIDDFVNAGCIGSKAPSAEPSACARPSRRTPNGILCQKSWRPDVARYLIRPLQGAIGLAALHLGTMTARAALSLKCMWLPSRSVESGSHTVCKPGGCGIGVADVSASTGDRGCRRPRGDHSRIRPAITIRFMRNIPRAMGALANHRCPRECTRRHML